MNGCFSLAVTESMSPVSSPETIQLSEEEAEQLAEELKQQLRQGERLAGDTQAIERMVAGLGDRGKDGGKITRALEECGYLHPIPKGGLPRPGFE